MSDKNQNGIPMPAFFNAEPSQHGTVELVDGNKLSDWLRTHNQSESIHDGFHRLIIRPENRSHPEFPLTTRIIYMNGINTSLAAEIGDALAYASLVQHDVEIIYASTHGIVPDVLQVAGEKWLPIENSWRNAPEKILAMEILGSISSDGDGLHFRGEDIHFVAHSRGAIIFERGVELAQAHLGSLHYNDVHIQGIFSHITVETFEGASHRFPYVKAVNYCNAEDFVSTMFGACNPVRRLLDEIPAYAANHESQWGTFVAIRPADNLLDVIPVLNLPYVHDAQYAFSQRRPFWETYNAQEKHLSEIQRAAYPHDLLDYAQPRNPGFFPVMSADAVKGASLAFVSDGNFHETGKILVAGNDRIAQAPRPGLVIMYRTADLLSGMSKPDAEAALQRLRDAAKGHEDVELSRNGHGLTIHGMREKLAEAVKSEIRKAMKQGREMGEARAKEEIFRFLHPDVVRGTFNGQENRYHPGGLNANVVVSALDDKDVTLRTSGGTEMVLNRSDLLHNAKHPRALDALLHEAHQTGNPVHMVYAMSGKMDGMKISRDLYHGHSMRRGM